MQESNKNKTGQGTNSYNTILMPVFWIEIAEDCPLKIKTHFIIVHNFKYKIKSEIILLVIHVTMKGQIYNSITSCDLVMEVLYRAIKCLTYPFCFIYLNKLNEEFVNLRG